MTVLSNGVDSGSAQVREYRSRAAQALMRLLSPGESIDGVSWDELERLPAWFLFDSAELVRVTNQVGVIAIAPTLTKSIDGRLLNSVSALVGKDFLRRLLGQSGEASEIAGEFDTSAIQNDPASLIRNVGSSVLLSTIENETLAGIIGRRFKSEHTPFDRQLASSCVEQAQALATSLSQQFVSDAAAVA